MNKVSQCGCGGSESADLIGSSESCSRVPAGITKRGRRGGRGLVRVTSRKMNSKTRIRGSFVDGVFRLFGLEYRHGVQLECGQRRGQRRRQVDGFATAGGSTTGLTRALFGGWSTESPTSALSEEWMPVSCRQNKLKHPAKPKQSSQLVIPTQTTQFVVGRLLSPRH